MKYPFSFLGLDSVSALLFRSPEDFVAGKDPDEHIVILTKATTYSPQLVATCNNDTCCSQNELHQENESHPSTTRIMSHKKQSTKSVRFDEARNQIILLIDSHDPDTVEERWYSGVDLMHFKYSTNLLAKTIRQSEARNNTRKLYHLVSVPGGGRRFEQRTPGNSSTSGPAITIAFAHCCQLCASSSNDMEEKPCESSTNNTNSSHPRSLLPLSVQTQLQHWLESPQGGTGGCGPLRWGLAFAASATMMQERTQRRRELYQIIQNHQQHYYKSPAREEHQVPSKNRYTDIEDESSSSWWSFLTRYDRWSDSDNSRSDEEQESCMTSTRTTSESAEPMESFAVDTDEELRRACQRISQPSVLFARELALAQVVVQQREG